MLSEPIARVCIQCPFSLFDPRSSRAEKVLIADPAKNRKARNSSTRQVCLAMEVNDQQVSERSHLQRNNDGRRSEQFPAFQFLSRALKKSEYSATDILFEPRRLPGYGQNGLPPEAIRVDLLFLKHQDLDRDMDKCVMQKSDNQAGFASHRGVHGIARIQIT